MPAGTMPLIEVLVEVPDFRMAQSKRYSLVAMRCGYRGYGALAEWGRNYGAALVRAWGFRNAETPCAATLHTVFRCLDVTQFEACESRWAEQVLAAYPAEQTEACDGKTLRGSRKLGAPGAHLLAAFSWRLG